MWWARSEVVDVYLSGCTFAVRSGLAAPEVQAINDGDWHTLLQAAIAERPRQRWRVWLGGRLCSLHRVEPIDGVRNIEEAEAALSALLSAEGAPVCARMATWSPGGGATWVAACMPQALPAELAGLVQADGGQLLSVRPWWAAPSAPSATSVAMCDDESVSYWRSDGRGRVTAAASFGASADTRAATLQRLQVSGPLEAWRLDLRATAEAARPGFAIVPLTEGCDATATAAV